MAELFRNRDGVAMIEATVGIALLLFAALIACQIILVFHGALAAHSAAARTARTYAITGLEREAQRTYETQTATTLGALTWSATPRCRRPVSTVAECTVTVEIATFLPGAGAFTGGGLDERIKIDRIGSYPIGSRSAF